jgi:hypothetical protein
LVKVSESVIARYCDYCTIKTRAYYTCALCGKDMCEHHRFAIEFVPRDLAENSRDDQGGTPAQRLESLIEGSMYGDICPECASSSSLANIGSSLIERSKNAAKMKEQERRDPASEYF